MQKSSDLKNMYHAYKDFQNFVQITKKEQTPSVKSDDDDSYYVEAPGREPFQDVSHKVNIVEPTTMPNIRNVLNSAPPKKMNKKH